MTEHLHDPLYRDTPLILSVSGVTKSFDGFKAIDDLNFYLEEGELRTIIGPNGAGKSTFMDIITGRTRPDVGSVTLHERDGHDVNLARLREFEINRLGIGRKFQTPRSTSRTQSTITWCYRSIRTGACLNSVLSRIQPRPRTHYAGAEDGASGGPQGRSGRLAVTWAEAVAGDRHAAGAGSAILLLMSRRPV